MRTLTTVLAFGALATLSCKTTQPVAKIDTASGTMELYTSDDSYSMLNPEEDYLDKALEQNSAKENKGDLAQMNNSAQLLIAKGDLAKAEKTCFEILQTDFKNTDAKMSMAQIALKKGELSKAKLILNGLAADRKNDSRILNLLGMVAIRQSHNAEALALFKQGLRVNPEDMAIRMNLGVLYLQYRQINDAAVQFERILGKIPNHSDAQIHLAVVNLARGEGAKAKDVLKNYSGRKKDGSLAEYNYASLLDQEENYEEALNRLQVFLENAPKDAERTNAAFALAESIHKKQEALGQKVSREEIQAMAQKFKTVDDEKPAKTANAETLDPEMEDAGSEKTLSARKKPSVAPEAAVAEPVKKTAKPASYELEEIDQLEKELQ